MSEDQQPTPHVMISYTWRNGSQDRMLKLKAELEKVGFNVWMDVEKMSGNMDQSMAEAVQNSAAVLVCFSKEYEESEPCRKEAQYASGEKKPIIPLKFKDHKATGWLGININPLLYYSVETDEDMMKSLPKIIEALDHKGVGRRPGFSGTRVVPQPTDDSTVQDTPDVTSDRATIVEEMAEGTFGKQKDYKKALTASIKTLTDNLDPADVLISLVAKGAIKMQHKTQIQGKSTKEEGAALLVEILLTRKLEHYEMFMTTLEEERDDLWREVKSKEGPTANLKPTPDQGPTANLKPNPDPDARSKEVGSADLAEVAQQIAAWEEVDLIVFYSRGLNISDNIRIRATQGGTTPVAKALRVLEKWHEVETSKATRGKILDALKLEDHNNIIKSLEEMWNIA